jgi:hypothetical protein
MALAAAINLTEIPKRSQMMDCIPMTTSMMSNLKLHADLDSNLVDPSMYRQLIGSLM